MKKQSPDRTAVDALMHGDHGDPFSVLGMHAEGNGVALPAILETLVPYEVDEAHVEWKTSLAFRSPTHLRLRVSHPSG